MSIELPVATRHRRDMTEKLLKATLNPNTHTHLNTRRYQTDIVTPVLLPHIRANRGIMVAQDKAPHCVARTTQQLLHANNVRMLPWPACSLDLNPIEHIWDLLKCRLRELPPPNNLAHLECNIGRVWRNIAQATIQNYVGSMRRRC